MAVTLAAATPVLPAPHPGIHGSEVPFPQASLTPALFCDRRPKTMPLLQHCLLMTPCHLTVSFPPVLLHQLRFVSLPLLPAAPLNAHPSSFPED